MRRVLLSGGLSVLKDGSDDHDTLGFQKIAPCLLSIRQQIQHNVLIILMALRHPNTCKIIKHWRLSEVNNGSLENLKAVITHGQADSRERRRVPGVCVAYCCLWLVSPEGWLRRPRHPKIPRNNPERN